MSQLKSHIKLVYVAVFILVIVTQIQQSEARGKKRKSNSANAASCASRGLDCSATCCLDTTCALDLSDCAGYINRELNEIYIGFGTIVALMTCIPSVLWFMNFCLMHKFCKRKDENFGIETGGYSFFELMVLFCFCGICCKQRRNQDDESFDNSPSLQSKENLKAIQSNKSKISEEDLEISEQGRSTDSNLKQNQFSKTAQQSKIPRNKCLKCMCIVFCCMDSNINEESGPVNEENNQLLVDEKLGPNGEASIQFDSSKQDKCKQAKNRKGSSVSLEDIDQNQYQEKEDYDEGSLNNFNDKNIEQPSINEDQDENN
ncbi:UNKNOWN [Stylonychia lemnae]|uniref:Transmembrane protein n=1 Tax=Stylonychia lemnae TaxID=5949 RepID=A0A078AZ16_STYLE|nr:UNKNOWN [Stylonychia lemnae]|eukprot:CDW86442.1 UNKNOWN [Stylonychia lemnae]